MQMVPRCPRCGVEVQPHWDRCEACGYSHHDEEDAAGAASTGATGEAGSAAPPEPPSAPAPGFFDDARPDAGAVAAPPSPPPPPPPLDDDEPIAFDLPPGDGPAPHAGGSEAPADLPPPPPPPPPSAAGEGPPAPPAADPLSQWEAQAAPDPGPSSGRIAGGLVGAAPAAAAGPPPGAGTPPGAAPPRDPGPAAAEEGDRGDGGKGRARSRVTAAQATGQRSPFALNRLVVIGAVVLAALVLVWQASALMKSDDKSAKPAPGTTIPPLGAIASTTTPLTTPDGVTIVPPSVTTSTLDGRPQCDSATSVYSADGRGYRPCGGGFQVDLPGRADVRSTTGDTPVGQVRWTVLSSTDNTKDPWVRSVVAFGDLPREPAPEEVAGVEEALVAQLYGKPGGATTFQDLPGVTFSTIDSNGEQVTGIAFVRGTQAFAVATRSEGSPDAAFNALRDSFAFV